MFCQHCGSEIPASSKFCQFCGKMVGRNVVVIKNDPLIPDNGKALAAYYLGIFSLLLPILSVPSLIFGFLALEWAESHPQARGKIHAWTGIIFSIITLVFWAAIIVLIVDYVF